MSSVPSDTSDADGPEALVDPLPEPVIQGLQGDARVACETVRSGLYMTPGLSLATGVAEAMAGMSLCGQPLDPGERVDRVIKGASGTLGPVGALAGPTLLDQTPVVGSAIERLKRAVAVDKGDEAPGSAVSVPRPSSPSMGM